VFGWSELWVAPVSVPAGAAGKGDPARLKYCPPNATHRRSNMDEAVWLAEAARETGGRVVSMGLADYKARFAREALGRSSRMGLSSPQTT